MPLSSLNSAQLKSSEEEHSTDSSISYKEADLDVPVLRVMLIGPTGVGKSSTGNTLYLANIDHNRKLFAEGFTGSSKTMWNKQLTFPVLGRKLTLVDTPGIDNTQDSPERIIKEIRTAIERSREPYDAFLYVIDCFKNGLKLDKRTVEVFKMLQSTISETFWSHVVLVFTYEDNFLYHQQRENGEELQILDFNQFIQADALSLEPGVIGQYVEKTGGAAVTVENKLDLAGDRKRIQEMAGKVLRAVENVRKRNSCKGFSKEMLIEEPKFPNDFSWFTSNRAPNPSRRPMSNIASSRLSSDTAQNASSWFTSDTAKQVAMVAGGVLLALIFRK